MHRRLAVAAALAASLTAAGAARAASYDQQSRGMRALYTGVAVVANVTPFVSALYAPACLPGYLVCKLGNDPQWHREFDPKLGLDTRELFAFIEETQRPEWEALVTVHGGDDAVAHIAIFAEGLTGSAPAAWRSR